MITSPKTYNWIGKGDSVLYWDDPNNWKEGEYPDRKEAIAVFSNSINQDTRIVLRKDIHLAQIWLSEKYSITFESEEAPDVPVDDAPKLLFETSNQFSRIFVDIENKANHLFAIRWILHSCCFLVPHRDLGLGKPIPDGAHISTIEFTGNIGNYKDPERASLQVFGNLNVQLNSSNSFIGPVVAKDFAQVRAMSNGAIPEGSPINLENGGNIYTAEGVFVRTKELKIDGEKQKPGIYVNEKLTSNELAEVKNIAKQRFSNSEIRAIKNVTGMGGIIVNG